MGSRVRQLADEALNVTVWSHHEQSVSEHDGSVFISHDQKNTEKKKQKNAASFGESWVAAEKWCEPTTADHTPF